MPGTRTSATDAPRAADVRFYRVKRGEYIGITLDDGRVIGVPLALYPTLLAAKPGARKRWQLLGRGHGIHWPDLDLDLSTEGLLAARPEATTAARRSLQSSDLSTQVLHAILASRGTVSVSDLAELLAERYPKEQLRRLMRDLEKRLDSISRERPARKSA